AQADGVDRCLVGIEQSGECFGIARQGALHEFQVCHTSAGEVQIIAHFRFLSINALALHNHPFLGSLAPLQKNPPGGEPNGPRSPLSFVLEEKSRREKWRQSKCRRELPICASGKTSLSPGGRTGPLGIFTDPAHRAESPLRTGFLSTVDSGKRGGETRSPCTSGLRLTMGQRSNPLAW